MILIDLSKLGYLAKIVMVFGLRYQSLRLRPNSSRFTARLGVSTMVIEIKRAESVKLIANSNNKISDVWRGITA